MEKEKSELQSKESKESNNINWKTNLVFLFSNNMAQWLAPYMGYTIGIPKFFSEYIWYIIYLVVWITIFSHQNIKYNFTKIEWAWGFGGLLLGVRAMMFLFGLYDQLFTSSRS